MQTHINNKRNEHGVKYSSDQYRTINGEHYIQWTSDFNDETVKGYRVAGVKVMVIKDEMYIRHADMNKALQLPETL